MISDLCGLFGMMGQGVTQRDISIFTDLGIASQMRGLDSCGVFHIESATGYWKRLYKTENTFSWLCKQLSYKTRDKEIGSLLNSSVPDVYMGHVRYATTGGSGKENAHPFEFPSLVGAHNGTLKDWQYYDNKYTDSELMFDDMDEKGIIPVLSSLDSDSAWAISLYHKDDKVMYFMKNEHRPLAFAFLKDRGVLYWASELGMLRYILRRAGEDFYDITIPDRYLFKINPKNVTKDNILKNEEEKGYLQIFEPVDEIPKKVVKVKEKTNVINYPSQQLPPKKHNHIKPTDPGGCKCGNIKFGSYFKRSYAHRGLDDRVTYDPKTKQFTCVGCEKDVKVG